MSEETKSTRLSVDEILDMASAIARDEEATGADRMRAMKMVSSINTSAVILPEPLKDPEVIERLARLDKAAGLHLAKLAFRKAFPHAKQGEDLAPVLTLEQLPPEVLAEASKIISVKTLYRAFPEVKRSGTIPGFPRRGSLAAQQNFCQRVAAQLILDREQRKIDGGEAP